MKRTKQRTVKSTIKKAKSNESVKEKNPLQVYCRVRPLQSESEISCVCIEPPNSLLLTVADTNRGAALPKQIRFTFKSVFNESATQEQVFHETSLPLVENLLAGKNGLLFTYGVSNSGKSFTMDGTPDNYGIMPMSINVIFNSIKKCQAPKYLFKPDKMNGFEIQSEPDALLERQKELMSYMKNPKSAKRKDPSTDMISGRATSHKLNVNEDNMYSVFITYIEIYNNSVYDLLEDYQSDDCTRVRPPQPKIIREDATKNMYVNRVNEIEVTTPEEAYEIFYKGQKRRRLAHTALNTESSRSHSVFTIRLVQAPLDLSGDGALDDGRSMGISQLSLVDLAGSERSSRAKTYGQRLREAGNINNSLMTLRSCLELLRENQQNGTDKMLPYRESRLTHLFKNYFDGEGDVRMIICINPRAEDCDEINHVLKFAEMSQEVKVNHRNRPYPIKEVSCPSTVNRTNELAPPASTSSSLNSSFLMSCRFQQPFPVPDFSNLENDGFIAETLQVLLARKEKAKELQTHIKSCATSFRAALERSCGELSSAQDENRKFADLNQDKDKAIEELQRKIHQMESEKLNLKMKCTSNEHYLRSRENELASKEQQLTKEQEAREREKMRLKDQGYLKTEKMAKELQRQKSQMEMEMWQRDRRLRKVKMILDGGPGSSHTGFTVPVTPKSSSESDGAKSCELLHARNRHTPSQFRTPSKCTEHALDLASYSASKSTRGRENTATNPRAYRRSRSAGPGDVWLDHRPPNVPPDTLFQPVMKKSHPVSKLTDIKDVSKSSKYCLTVLDKDSDGDIETCLYKGDVLPTASGGAQVTFNDIEILKQKSPINSPPRKRASPAMPHEDVENRCGTSVERRAKKTRR